LSLNIIYKLRGEGGDYDTIYIIIFMLRVKTLTRGRRNIQKIWDLC